MEKIDVPKRPREAQMEKDLNLQEYSSKKHKPYKHILSLLDLEEEESTQDLYPMMTTLQQEITCVSYNYQDTLLISSQEKQNDQNNLTSNGCNILEDDSITLACFSTSHHVLKEEEEDEKVKVMRHLLEASDDELGIPNTSGDDDRLIGFGGEDDGFNGGDEFSSLCCDKLWELEDERANYYALLQSQLFMWGH